MYIIIRSKTIIPCTFYRKKKNNKTNLTIGFYYFIQICTSLNKTFFKLTYFVSQAINYVFVFIFIDFFVRSKSNMSSLIVIVNQLNKDVSSNTHHIKRIKKYPTRIGRKISLWQVVQIILIRNTEDKKLMENFFCNEENVRKHVSYARHPF